MISFKQFILNEDRVDFIKEKNPEIDTSHDTLAKHRNASDIIDHFASKADPTSKKVYTSWIIGQYKKKNIRQEDAPRIHKALSDFAAHKAKLANKDINSYKTLSSVEDVVEPHLGSTTSKREEKREIKHAGADLIHDSPTLSVYKLKTKEAACHYGAGTKWCTAAKSDNRFDGYNERGQLFVINHKDTGQKRQYHFKSNQFMDEKDNPVKLDQEVEKHPDLKNVVAFKNSNRGYYFAKNKTEFDNAMNKALNDENWYTRREAIQHPNATPEHISKALNDEDSDVRYAAIRHPNVTPEHISKALNDEDWRVRYNAIQRPNVTPKHISKALNDEDFDMRREAIRRPNATPEHISKALNDEDSDIRYAAIQHPNVTPEHISKALNDEDFDVRQAATQHPNATYLLKH